ncbi:MAG: ribose-phosphate diphosphokinase [Deltaproteobacteria bacterium]|nr:ribose-phosphate diphosphokinase [Deltaproteobacteria bacterium]MBI3388910.1 ribose-phosphate diphosphokinase [Deltaproteobacteria bacterium]
MRLRLHTFADSARGARDLATHLGTAPPALVEVHRFPDGETLVRVAAPVARHAVLVRSLFDPNTKLIETVLAADALRRSGAHTVTLVAPYLPYMRQDAVFRAGEPISQRVIGSLLRRAFDRVLTVEPHLHRTRHLAETFGRGARALSAAPVLAEWLRRAEGDILIVGPDSESEPWVRAIGRAAHRPWVFGSKQRLADRSVRIHFPPLPATTRAVIVDDIASSGATLAVAARALRRAGIRTVDAIVVHAIFTPGALARIRAAGVRRIVSCDTVPHPTNRIATAPLLAAALAAR